MAKQSFTSGQTLTAAQMNDLQTNDFNLTATTKTADATLVVGDRGTRVIGNAGTAITFTVPNSTFTAGDSVQVHNVGAGTVTIAAGTGLTLNSADVLTLGQYQSGTIYFTSASAALLFPTAKTAAAASGGFTFINSTTISAAATTNVNDVFSATYDNYKIIFVGTGSTGSDAVIGLRLRVSGSDANTNYTYQRTTSYGSTVFSNLDNLGTDEFFIGATNATSRFWFEATLMSPFLSVSTKYGATGLGDNSAGLLNYSVAGVNTNSTSYTGFSLLSTGTISGTLKVYGLANS